MHEFIYFSAQPKLKESIIISLKHENSKLLSKAIWPVQRILRYSWLRENLYKIYS